MTFENILCRVQPRQCRSFGGSLPSWLVDEWALLPVKDEQIELCDKNAKHH